MKLPTIPFRKVKEEKTLPALPEGPHEIMVLYSLHRSEISKTLELARKNEKRNLVYLAVWLVVWFSTYNKVLELAGPGVTYVLISLLYILPFVYWLRRFGPTAVQLGADGLRFHWVHSIGKYSSPWIPWQQIMYVSSQEYKRGVYMRSWQSRSLDFAIDVGSLAPDARSFLNRLKLLMGARRADPHFLTIRLDKYSIIHHGDVYATVQAVRNFLPSERVDSAIDSLIENQEEAGYTQLWLQEFKSSTDGAVSVGSVIGNGKYRIKRIVGSGGHAITYEAEQIVAEAIVAEPTVAVPTGSVAKVALKETVLPVAGGRDIRQRAIKNVAREAELLQRLNNDQIVKCREVFIEGHRAYLCLDFVEGDSLRAMAGERPFSEQETVGLARQMCTILGYLHSQAPPVMHRDFTPDNLILRPDGVLVLIDFNVAEQQEGSDTTTIVGKHCFIPPEQFRGKPVTQSDVYALGCTLFFLLTGQDPEPISQSHPKVIASVVSDSLDRLVADATALELTERFASVEKVLEALDQLELQECR